MRALCLAVFILIAANVPAQDVVKLSGRVVNPLSDSIKISYNDDIIAYYPKEFFAVLDKKGNFSITIPVPAGIYIQAEIDHGNRSAELIVRPGDSLVMAVDAAHFDSSVHYTGKGSQVENFIARHTLARGRMNQYTIKIKTDISKEPADFLKSIEQEKKNEMDFLNKNKPGLPVSFIQYWTAFYQYYNYFFMQQYPQVHEMIKYRRYTDTVPPQNYAVIKAMAYAFNDTLLQVPPYLLYLTGVLDIKLKAAGYVYLGKDEEIMQKIQDSVTTLAYQLLPPRSAEYFIAQNLYGRARNQELSVTESQFDTFKTHWPGSSYIPVIEKQVSMARKLAPGQPAPDFEIHTPDGKSMNLCDLRGKVIFLSFWASWCKQCIGEMMSEKKVQELIINKPLEFVYVSIGNDTAAERNIVNKLKIKGIFSDVAGGWNAKEVQQYGVQTLPAYYLIDEDGNFALRNCPHPTQSTQLILEIEKLFR